MAKKKCRKCNGSGLIAVLADESCSTEVVRFKQCTCKKGDKNENK